MMVRLLPFVCFGALATGCVDENGAAKTPRTPIFEEDVEGVVALDSRDRELRAAVAKAKQEFPKFREMWAERSPNDVFTVKKTFTDGQSFEHMWVLVDKFEGDRIQGHLQNDPTNLQFVKARDHVNMKVKDVKDWMVIKNGEHHGCFTLPVMQKHSPKAVP